MSEADTTTSPAAPRDVHQSLVAAQDDKIKQVVALVDAMGTRGEADALIAPLRSRLSQLRPPRPPRLGRLMYLPLDPLIVPNEQWYPGLLALPRGLLPPLTAIVERELGARTAILHEAVRQLPANDDFAVQSLGAMLWPEAARILRTASPATDAPPVPGLNAAEAARLQQSIGDLLAHGTALRDMLQRQRQGTPPTLPDLKRLLDATRTGPALSFALMTLLLMTLFPRLPGLLALAEHLASGNEAKPLLDQIADRAIGAIETRLSTGLTGTEPSRLAAEIDRMQGQLEALERSTAGGSSERRARIGTLRKTFEAGCQTRFRSILDTNLMASVQALPAEPDAARIDTLESIARDLRRFEQTARANSDGPTYFTLLGQAAQNLITGEDTMATTDRIRLIEILVGPDAAFALLPATAVDDPPEALNISPHKSWHHGCECHCRK